MIYNVPNGVDVNSRWVERMVSSNPFNFANHAAEAIRQPFVNPYQRGKAQDDLPVVCRVVVPIVDGASVNFVSWLSVQKRGPIVMSFLKVVVVFRFNEVDMHVSR